MSEEAREEHFSRCRRGDPAKVVMPKEEETLKFTHTQRGLEAPLIIYADFECLLEKLQGPAKTRYTRDYQLHTPCGYALLPVQRSCGEATFLPHKVYRGEDAVENFMESAIELARNHHNNMKKPLAMTREDNIKFRGATECHICKKAFGEEDPVRDHCHITGKFRGAAHNKCNLDFRLKKDVTVGFHNLRRYDGHLIMQKLGEMCDKRGDLELEVVAKTIEDYLSFAIKIFSKKRNAQGKLVNSYFRIRFIDTCQFLKSSLEKLVANLKPEDFKAMKQRYSEKEMELLMRKQVYPYDYMDSWKRFSEEKLPPQVDFYNILQQSHITQEDYAHAQEVFKVFGLKDLGEYHDLYVETDVRLLADVFESFRNTAMKHYELDPVHFITLPSFALDAMLKKTGVELDLLCDPDMYQFFEDGMRGGISYIGERRGDANNPYVPGYDPTMRNNYLIYLDVNNLYGKAMCEDLPEKEFQWIEDAGNFDINTLGNGRGGVLEVDLEYPKELHDKHDAYPLAPESLEITEDMLSPYALRMKTSSCKAPRKLTPNLYDKEKYIVHYKNLMLYLKHGMRLKKIHRGIVFKESAWMKPYILFNTEMRKQATSSFEKDFFKLLNNAVFGKTMENVRKYQDVKFGSTEKKQERMFSSPRLRHMKIYGTNLIAYHMGKAEVNLNKPISVGFSILDMSKTYMYQFFYEYMEPTYGHQNVRLHMTDTDSFIFGVYTEDLYKDMEKEMERYDFSDYFKEHPLHSTVNKKVLGKMKDETCGIPIEQIIGLRSKMYSLKYRKEEKKTAKGISRTTLKKNITHEDYVRTLDEGRTMRHINRSFQQEEHTIVSREQNKISLSAYDDKRYLMDDGISSRAYGHYKLV